MFFIASALIIGSTMMGMLLGFLAWGRNRIAVVDTNPSSAIVRPPSRIPRR